MAKKKTSRKGRRLPSPRTRTAGSAQSRTRVAKSGPVYVPPPDLSFEEQREYLERMYNGERHSEICEAMGILWRQVSLTQCHDKEFAEAFAEAEEVKNEMIQIRREEIADERGMEGWEEPVFYKGKMCGSIRRFSDSLLHTQMRKSKPLDYAERHMVSGPGGGPVHLHWADVPPPPKNLMDWERQVRSLNGDKVIATGGGKKKSARRKAAAKKTGKRKAGNNRKGAGK